MKQDPKNNFHQNFSDQDLEDNEDVISLSDYISVRSNLEPETYSSTDHDLFDFFTNNGGSIDLQQDELHNEYSKRDYFSLRSKSLYEHTHVLPTALERVIKERIERNRSESMRNLSYYNNTNSAANSQSKNQITSKVNFTAITTSMSDKSRRRMFMFGPVKFKPEMDIESIRKRQGRHGPMQISTMAEEKDGRRDLTVKYAS